MIVRLANGVALVLLSGSLLAAQHCDSKSCVGSCDSAVASSCDSGYACDSGRSMVRNLFDNAGCDSGGADACDAGGACCGAGLGGLRGLRCDSGACDAGSCDAGGCCGIANVGCCDRYFRAFVGWNLVQDIVFSPTDSATFNEGWGFGAAMGRYYQPCRRWEVEFAYRNNTGNDWITAAATQDFDGQINAYSGMANLIWDLRGLQVGDVTPYAGGGLGAALIDGDFLVGGIDTSIDDEAFAWQMIAGVMKPVSPCASAFAEYRFFGTTDVNVQQGGATIGETSYYAHNIFVGLQIRR